MGKSVYVRTKKLSPKTPGYWHESKKIEAVTTYLALGNLSQTSITCRIPYDTLKDWKSSEWWEKMVADIQNDENQHTDNKLTRSIDKALEAVMDRIENGDFQYDPKKGELIRVPVKLRDVQKVTTEFLNKRQLIRKLPTKITQDSSEVSARLLKLAESFAQFANDKQREKVIEHANRPYDEVEDVEDAIYVGREEELSEGADLGEEDSSEQGEGQGFEE